MSFQFNRAKRVKAALLTYQAEKRKEAEAKARKEAARAIILEAMGDETVGKIGNDVVLTVGERTTESVPIAVLRKEYPEVVAKHGKVTTAKVLNVTL